MAINRNFFFERVRATLFDGSLKASQVQGLTAILDKWNTLPVTTDDRWLAYMLGTAHHETGRTMQPVRETFASSDDQAIARLNAAFAKGVLTWVSTPYWRKDAEGKTWLGRGFVQVTHKANYAKMKTATGIDFTADPTLAMSLGSARSSPLMILRASRQFSVVP
jgi:predicted chitinase